MWEALRRVLAQRRIEYKVYETKYKRHAMELARLISAADEKEKHIVVVGGDGSINEVVNGITDYENVTLSVIPTGSGNDFARGLKLPENPEEGLLNILSCEKEELMDLGKVTCPETGLTRLYAISAGVGMDALVCKKTNTSRTKKVLNVLHLGKLSYLVLTVQSLFTMKTEKVRVYAGEGEKKLKFKELIFLAAMNFRAEGGGVPMAPGASAFDGRLSVCIVSGVKRWQAFFLLPILVIAKHEKLKPITMLDEKQITIKAKAPLVLHTDGEYLGEFKTVRFECLEKKLKIRR